MVLELHKNCTLKKTGRRCGICPRVLPAKSWMYAVFPVHRAGQGEWSWKVSGSVQAGLFGIHPEAIASVAKKLALW